MTLSLMILWRLTAQIVLHYFGSSDPMPTIANSAWGNLDIVVIRFIPIPRWFLEGGLQSVHCTMHGRRWGVQQVHGREIPKRLPCEVLGGHGHGKLQRIRTGKEWSGGQVDGQICTCTLRHCHAPPCDLKKAHKELNNVRCTWGRAWEGVREIMLNTNVLP